VRRVWVVRRVWEVRVFAGGMTGSLSVAPGSYP
jgi:hypothetical protein